MATRPTMLLVPLLGLLLAFAVPNQEREMAKTRRGRGAAGASQGSPLGSWGSPFRLKKHMVQAREWSGEALKRGRERLPFLTEVEAIVSTPDDAARVIGKDWAKALTVMGAPDLAARASLATQIANHVVAVYAPETGVIHILPENAQRAAEAAGNPKLMSDGTLRLLLVRMCIVALQRQHHPEWKEAADAADSLDALHTAMAVFQGRVQYQTRRVAGTMNQMDSSFAITNADDLVGLMTAPPADDAKPALKAFVEGVKFTLLKGENFMANVPRAFHDRLLATPPTSRTAIFDPKRFTEDLRNEAKRGPVKKLPGKVHGAFLAEIMSTGSWEHANRDLSADDVKGLLTPLEARYYSTALAAWKTGWAYRSTNAASGGSDIHDVYLLEFRSEGQAEGFVSLLRGAGKERGARLDDGAGRDLGLAGFHGADKGVSADGTRFMQWASEGAFVLGFRTSTDLAKDAAREVWDEAMESAAEDVAQVAGSRDSRRRRRGR